VNPELLGIRVRVEGLKGIQQQTGWLSVEPSGDTRNLNGIPHTRNPDP